MNCTPSMRLEQEFTESGDSTYAAEGTLAHEFADIALRYADGQISKKEYNKLYKELEKDELYSPEMDEEVAKYVTFVMEEFLEAKKRTPGAILLVEEKIDLSDYIPEGGGTNDSIIIADGVMSVNDLKYGKGVRVDAEENSQLMLYGLGALNRHELSYDIKSVKLAIIQPRLDHISEWIISAKELKKWGETQVKPKAALAWNGEGELAPGSWCRWCKAKARCRALAEKNLELAKHEFKKPELLGDMELLEVYSQLDDLTKWANAVADYIKDQALEGKKWVGYKLVEGRSSRKWSDTEKAMEVLGELKKAGVIKDLDELIETKLKGITAVEKALGKSLFQEKLDAVVVKPQGKPTLVPEDDKRPMLGAEQAKSDFK